MNDKIGFLVLGIGIHFSTPYQSNKKLYQWIVVYFVYTQKS